MHSGNCRNINFVLLQFPFFFIRSEKNVSRIIEFGGLNALERLCMGYDVAPVSCTACQTVLNLDFRTSKQSQEQL